MIEFQAPWVWLLLPLPLLVWFFCPPDHREHRVALWVPFIDRLQAIGTNHRPNQPNRRKTWIYLAIFWIGLLCSAARPTWYGEPAPLTQSGRDLLLAVDVSESMLREDFIINGRRVDRLTAVKVVLSDFIERRYQDRLGLILFGSQAYVQAPLTHDRLALKQLLIDASVGIAGPKTAIGDAIGLSIKRLDTEDAQHRVLILLTDGSNTAGELSPLQGAELAKNAGLKIYTIGIGQSQRGGGIDVTTLKTVAERTGGRYFEAQNTDTLNAIYKLLDELEAIDITAKTVRPQRSFLHYPLALAAFALLLATLHLWRPMSLSFGFLKSRSTQQQEANNV
jgi:Ca-activated chloride channel family protein